MAEGEGVGLAALLNSLAQGRVEERVRVVGGVLSLDEAVELGVLGRLLAEDRVAVDVGLNREVLENGYPK